MQGKIVIGTEIDTKGLEHGIKEIEKHSAEINVTTNEDEDLFKLIEQHYDDAKSYIENKPVEVAINDDEELFKLIEENYYNFTKDIESKPVEIKFEVKSFEKQINNIKEQMQQTREAINQRQNEMDNSQNDLLIELSSQEIKKLEAEYEVLNNKLVDLTNKQERYNQKVSQLNSQGQPKIITETQKTDLSTMRKEIDSIGSSIKKTIGSVVKWGLALFSVRSAYSFIRQAASTLSSTNKQIGADVQYIRFALASALQPVIERIIQLVYKLLAYINYIAKAWFGVNLFANATTKAFQKQNKVMGGTAKKAKELQKTLAGFDEMNILQENGDVTSGGGGGGVGLPTEDLSDISKIEIPGWIKWIAENKATVLDFFIQLGSLIAGIKIAKFFVDFAGGFKTLSGLGTLPIFGIIAGLGVTIVGISTTIKAIIEAIKDPSLSNIGSILFGIGTALGGISIALIAINSSNPLGWIVGGIAIVSGIVGVIMGWKDSQKGVTQELINSKDATNDLFKAQEKLKRATDNYTSASDRAKKAEKDLKDMVKKHGINAEELYKKYALGLIDIDNMTQAEKDVFDAYMESMSATKDLKKATRELNGERINTANSSATLSGAIFQEKKKFDDYFLTLVKGYENGEVSAKKMADYTLNMMDNMDSKTREVFLDSIPDSIRSAFSDTRIVRVLADNTEVAYKDIYNNTKKTFEKDIPGVIKKNPLKMKVETEVDKKSLNDTITQLQKKFGSGGPLGNLVNYVAKKTGMATGGIYVPPKLAVGGIINQPGRGVPLGSAIGGERGREGVVPLTDAQAMSELGYSIGRNVTINATIPVQIGNRQVVQEIRRINAEDDFAFNR